MIFFSFICMQVIIISKLYIQFIIVKTTISISKTTGYEITKQTEYLTPTKRDQHTPGIFLMRLIHAKHIFKIFLRCVHILKKFSRLIFFMNVIIRNSGKKMQCRVAEVYQVCNKICEIFIETYKINMKISSLLLRTNFESSPWKRWFFFNIMYTLFNGS